MAANGLEELYKSLQLTASNVQNKLEKQQTDRLHSIINVDQSGQAEFISWECLLPAGDGGKRTHELLRIPLASLYTTEQMSISELSIEFDCDIKKQKSASSQQKYKINPLSDASGNKEKHHSFKLIAQATNDFIPDLIIDELPVDDYLEHFDELSAVKNKWYSLNSNISRRLFLLLTLLIIDITIMFFSKI